MKKHIFSIIILICVISCKKEELLIPLPNFHPGPMDTGEVQALRNGEPWQATAYARYHTIDHNIKDSSYVGISFVTFSNEGFNRENFTVDEVFLKIGKRIIRGQLGKWGESYDGYIGAVYSIAEDDGDLLNPPYFPEESSEGSLELTRVDLVNKEIEGKFTRVIFRASSPDPRFPDRVVFQDGTFKARIVE